ncbi:MAG: hypothetical protein IJU79_00710 [Desulfovibrionaceae bacterium]|nr:hypothetical protein [Desulfovibrionaceae bacterium]
MADPHIVDRNKCALRKGLILDLINHKSIFLDAKPIGIFWIKTMLHMSLQSKRRTIIYGTLCKSNIYVIFAKVTLLVAMLLRLRFADKQFLANSISQKSS